MVKVSIDGGLVHCDVEGMDQFWSLRSHLEFPLSHVTAVHFDPDAARGWWHGLKLFGSQIPGFLTAGTFYEHGGVVFYDVHDPDRTVVIELDHERYSRLIIEVEDPESTLAMIQRAIAKR